MGTHELRKHVRKDRRTEPLDVFRGLAKCGTKLTLNHEKHGFMKCWWDKRENLYLTLESDRHD